MKLPIRLLLTACLLVSFSASAKPAAEAKKGKPAAAVKKEQPPAAKKEPPAAAKRKPAPAKKQESAAAKPKTPGESKAKDQKPAAAPRKKPAEAKQAKTPPAAKPDENARRDAEARERLKKLVGDVVKLTGGVEIEHLTAEKAHGLARELRAIQAEARVEVGILSDDRDDEEIHQVFALIDKSLGALTARIGDAGSSSATGRRRLGHPVPQFENRPAAREKAESLRDAQHAFVDAINDPDSKAQRLVDLIVAEEELAWEAGWPFSERELGAIKKNEGKIPRQVYLSRLKRGIGLVRAHLKTEHDANGRMIRGRQFALHVPVEKKLAELANLKIKALRGHDFAWVQVGVPFDAETEASLLNPDLKLR